MPARLVLAMTDESHARPHTDAHQTFLSHLAHEFSNPCAACRLSAETALALLEVGAPADQLRPCLENIIDSLDHCDQIVLTMRQSHSGNP